MPPSVLRQSQKSLKRKKKAQSKLGKVTWEFLVHPKEIFSQDGLLKDVVVFFGSSGVQSARFESSAECDKRAREGTTRRFMCVNGVVDS